MTDNPADRREFERIKAAKRGTVRIERADDYVIIAHCHTTTTIEVVKLDRTVWYVSIYNGDPMVRREFADDLSYDALEAFIVATIAADNARQTRPASR